MNSVFARRRSRLLAMKALRDSYASGEKTFTCPRCGQDSERKLVAQALSARNAGTTSPWGPITV